MSSDDSWTERGRQLHQSFFAKRNEQRLAELRETLTANERKQALASASGISDDEVFDHLLNANIQAETIAALGIVPLLAVAWADGQLDDREKQAVLAACEDEGIAPGSQCYALLDGWLQQAPSANLLSEWKDFISAARTKLSAEAL